MNTTNLLAINWDETFLVVTFGIVMVFITLVALVGVIKLFGYFFAPKVLVRKTKRGTNPTSSDSEEEFVKGHLTAECSAAIGMALQLYYDDIHDIESAIVTIKKVERRYSPWSSKIYGLTNLVK